MNPQDELKKLQGANPLDALGDAQAQAAGGSGQVSPFGGNQPQPMPGVGGGQQALAPLAGNQPQPQPQAQPPQQMAAMPAAGPAAPQAAAGYQRLGGAPAAQARPQVAVDPAPANLDPGKAWADLTAQFQQKHGRAMTAEEAKALQGYAGYAGGAINQGMIDKAAQGINAYTGDLKNPFGPAAPGGPAAPAPGPVDPGIASGGLAQTELQKLLTTGGTDGMELDLNNPAIQAQRKNFDRVNSRETGRTRLANAERAAARGTLGTGGFDADQAAAEQAQGDRSASFESQLMTQELQGQRERVMQGLQMALQSGDQAQARALQERLGTLDATLRREGMDIQSMLGKGQLNLGLLNAMLGDKQAGNAIGLGYFNGQNSANSNLLQILMGGL